MKKVIIPLGAAILTGAALIASMALGAASQISAQTAIQNATATMNLLPDGNYGLSFFYVSQTTTFAWGVTTTVVSPNAVTTLHPSFACDHPFATGTEFADNILLYCVYGASDTNSGSYSQHFGFMTGDGTTSATPVTPEP